MRSKVGKQDITKIGGAMIAANVFYRPSLLDVDNKITIHVMLTSIKTSQESLAVR